MTTSPEVQAIRDNYLMYLDELINDIRNPPDHPHYFETVSLGIDYLSQRLKRRRFEFTVTVDPRLISYWQAEYSYANLFEHYQLWDHDWYYAQIFTEGVVSQTILRLPELARQYHIVVFGPSKLNDLAERWSLEPAYFTFFSAPKWPPSRPDGNIFVDPILPPLTTFRTRYEMLDRLASVQSDRPKMYLFEAGTCSQWWVYRLFKRDPNHFYLDVGRVLELWYPEYVWPFKPRIKGFYRRAARQYYGETRYRQLLAELHTKQENQVWLQKR